MVFSVCCCFVGCGYQTDEKHKVERVSIRDQYSLQCSSYKLGKSYTLCIVFHKLEVHLCFISSCMPIPLMDQPNLESVFPSDIIDLLLS